MYDIGTTLLWYPVLKIIINHLNTDDTTDAMTLNLVSKPIYELKRYIVTELVFNYTHILTPRILERLLFKYPNVISLHLHQTSYPILYIIGQFPVVKRLTFRVYGIFTFYTELIPQITHLDMSRSLYLNNILGQLENLPNLRWLNISNNQYICQEELEHMIGSLHKIETLIFQNCTVRYNKHVFDGLEHLCNISVLNIKGSHFDIALKRHLDAINQRRTNKGLCWCQIIH